MVASLETALLCLLAFQDLAGLLQLREITNFHPSSCCMWTDDTIALTLVFDVVTTRP